MSFKVALIEFERGWGSKIDEVREFSTREERDAFIVEFNSQNDKDIVPDWYMIAEVFE